MQSDGIQYEYSTTVMYVLYVFEGKNDNAYPPDEKIDIFIVRTERSFASLAPP
jgi:hypothetical protein